MQVRSISGAGRVSAWAPAVAQTYLVLGRTVVPPDVATFTVTRLATGVRQFQWTYADPEGDGPPTDLAGVRIRYRPGSGFAWSDLNPLHSGVLPAAPWETAEPGPAGTYTFGIVAENRSGLQSLTPKLITVALARRYRRAGTGNPRPCPTPSATPTR